MKLKHKAYFFIANSGQFFFRDFGLEELPRHPVAMVGLDAEAGERGDVTVFQRNADKGVALADWLEVILRSLLKKGSASCLFFAFVLPLTTCR